MFMLSTFIHDSLDDEFEFPVPLQQRMHFTNIKIIKILPTSIRAPAKMLYSSIGKFFEF